MYRRWSALRWLGVILVVVVSFSVTGYCANETIALDSVSKDAEQGDAIAQFNLGDMYYNGEGVSVDYQEAMKWYSKAAEQGLADAQSSLGCQEQTFGPMAVYRTGGIWDKAKNVITDGCRRWRKKDDALSFGDGMAPDNCRRRFDE